MRGFIFLMLIVPVIVVAQGDLPEYGDMSDIKSLSKAYLIADSTDARKMILKELGKYKNLTIVNSPDEAEFFIEYKVLKSERVQAGVFMGANEATSEMTVYTLRDKRRRIAWAKTEDNAGLSKPNEINLTRNFIKALKKARR